MLARVQELRALYEDRLAQIRHDNGIVAASRRLREERAAAGLDASPSDEEPLEHIGARVAECIGDAELLAEELERAEVEIEARGFDPYEPALSREHCFDQDELAILPTPPWQEMSGPVVEV